MLSNVKLSGRYYTRLNGSVVCCLPSTASKTVQGSKRSIFKAELDGNTALKNAGQLAAGVLAGLSISLGSICIGSLPAYAEAGPVMRLPASAVPEVFARQQTMIEAWSIIGESFFDGDFNGRDWPEQLKTHMMAAFNSGDPILAGKELDDMLQMLGDPYTRHIDASAYQDFRVSTDGEMQGVGLLIASQMSDGGNLVVLSPIKGGPADRAGILPGDEVVRIDGHRTKGMDGQAAAQLLRGQGGTEVRVQLARRSDQIPGVPGLPEARVSASKMVMKEITIKRDRVNLSPVYSTALKQRDEGRSDVGYIRLAQFSNNSAADMRAAILELEAQGVGEYILDLRSNPGGLVSAGINVASLWLDGVKPVFSVHGRDGEPLVQTTEDPSLALTHKPLAVLVNEDSASASEILAGALKDNHRAVLVGDGHTYGKGKIQSVFELHDHSALFVTVAKYKTPSGMEILDHVGLRPDKNCQPGRIASFRKIMAGNNSQEAPALSTRGASTSGPPSFSPGLPVGPAMEATLKSQLNVDACVLAAEEAMEHVKHS